MKYKGFRVTTSASTFQKKQLLQKQERFCGPVLFELMSKKSSPAERGKERVYL